MVGLRTDALAGDPDRRTAHPGPAIRAAGKALLSRLQSEKRWHADETRWMVFAEREGKIGHRWYLWVFHSESVIHFVLDPTRSAQVPIAELSDSEGGIVICDRYSGYQELARTLGDDPPGLLLGHQRRDFIELANAHPDLSGWACPGSNGLASSIT
ncbi:MAG: transposase [Candidatus Accumulibacter sp.]|uniref:Transposase n=1 Tax=Candidatus Accumulibacter affinis TaxID=2954384 RepID=A0A935T8J5_9PROT|nr:transposase [Candidatus Accumulibacter affinis]